MGGGAGLPRPDPVAAGIAGSGDAHRRKQCRRGSGDQSRNLSWVRLSPWRHARSRCLRAIWPRRNITWKCCSTIRQGMRWRAGAPGASAIRECSPSSVAISAPDYGCCAPASTNQARPGVPQFFTFLMAEALGRAGQIADGLAAIEEAIVRSERTEERWANCRVAARQGRASAVAGRARSRAAAEDHFRQALDWARRQGALSWELRAATSLARLLSDQGRSADASALLRPVYDRFTEGFETADLKAAKALLDALAALAIPQTRDR